MRLLLSALIIASCTLLSAQTEDNSLYAKSPVYVQAAVGAFPNVYAFAAEVSASVGYRFNQHIGLGLEYRSTGSCNESFCDDAQLLGLRFRNVAKRGWLTGLGVGMVLSAHEGSDGFTAYAYRSGGGYVALDFGYQFRWGLTLGLYATGVGGAQHESLQYSDDTNIYEPTGNIQRQGFVSGGFKIGFALPGRGKRR